MLHSGAPFSIFSYESKYLFKLILSTYLFVFKTKLQIQTLKLNISQNKLKIILK